ncbi:hypothetical protein [Shewanella surugensis]|uniref:Uncharacterized protein n=1 Tax=Shewanella surugensis TaxID=212020 RepID=A0ABT0LJ95_9GAMM|nr:hypothetical protein [Shewanella surugensis]MCL1127758.1 hypothetical protein [Shewanella surugensis]
MANNIKTGKDTVVIGKVSGEIGEGSVVIGPTDDRGNTIINTPMAIGRDASAGPNSIAIGAGASAGSDIFYLLQQLRIVPEVQSNETLVKNIDKLTAELQKLEPNSGKIQGLWSIIQGSATVGGAIGFVQTIGTILGF